MAVATNGASTTIPGWTITDFNTLYSVVHVFNGLFHAVCIIVVGGCVAAGRPMQAVDAEM
jgi:hypothetical protein